MEVLTTGPVLGTNRDRVILFLRAQGYSQSIQPADAVFAAWSGSEVVGALRLAVEDGVLVLRGMRVREDLRRRGIGRQLLGRIDEAIGETTCWCIPYGWLTGFYGTIGFKIADVEAVPEILVERLARYTQQRLDVAIMVRRAGHG
jgi:N-acetylglutamate synthase-like GNAT family acetyltransferase